MALVSIFLFGKPEQEIDLEKAKPPELKNLGENLKERMSEIAKAVEKLEKHGWERSPGLYDISFYKEIKYKEAEKELKKLGIKDLVDIIEDEELE